MAAQSWQACARMHNHVDGRRNAREAGNAMRGHLASANSTRLRRPPLTTHFQVVEEQQLCLRRSTSDGKLMRCRWGKTNVRSGTMWEILVTDGCGRILEKRKAAPQQWAPAAVDATSDRVLINTPLQGEGSRDKQQLLFTDCVTLRVIPQTLTPDSECSFFFFLVASDVTSSTSSSASPCSDLCPPCSPQP